jgi:hypothetical protein
MTKLNPDDQQALTADLQLMTTVLPPRKSSGTFSTKPTFRSLL